MKKPGVRIRKKATSNDALVWEVCSRIKPDMCNGCPREVDVPNYGRGKQMCRALAEECIGYVLANQTPR